MSDQQPTDTIFDFKVRLASRPGAPEKLASTLTRNGIHGAAVSAGGVIDLARLSRQLVEGGHVTADPDNNLVRDFCRRSSGRFVPVYFANPHRAAQEYADQASGYRALEISPAVHGVPLTDPRVTDLVRVATAARHSVYVVCLDPARMRCGGPGGARGRTSGHRVRPRPRGHGKHRSLRPRPDRGPAERAARDL